MARYFPFQGLARSMINAKGIDDAEFEFPSKFLTNSMTAVVHFGELDTPLRKASVREFGKDVSVGGDASSVSSTLSGNKRKASVSVGPSGSGGLKTTGLEEDPVSVAVSATDDFVDGPIAVEAHWSIAWDQGLIRPRGLVERGMVKARAIRDVVIEIVCQAPVCGRLQDGETGTGAFFPIRLGDLEKWAHTILSIDDAGGAPGYWLSNDEGGAGLLSETAACHLWFAILETLLNYESEGLIAGAKKWRFYVPSNK